MNPAKLTLVPRIGLAVSLLMLGACAAQKPAHIDYAEPIFDYQRIVPEGIDDPAGEVYDPWAGMNKRIYNFNYGFDRYVFLPAVRGYQWIMPGFAEKGVSNFFNNVRDIIMKALAFDRAVNTTLGLFGLFDMATNMDIPRPIEDFGQTLGRWGVGTGPYLVIPFLGPSNVRDGIGLLPDLLLQNVIYEEAIASPQNNYMGVLNALDTRSQVPFRYYETNTVFEYETVRWLISTKRELDVAK